MVYEGAGYTLQCILKYKLEPQRALFLHLDLLNLENNGFPDGLDVLLMAYMFVGGRTFGLESVSQKISCGSVIKSNV